MIKSTTLDHIANLANLKLSEEEKQQALQDMEELLAYVDKLQELDTKEEEPMSHIFPVTNVFREDVVAESSKQQVASMLANAPAFEGDYFKVPSTIEPGGDQ